MGVSQDRLDEIGRERIGGLRAITIVTLITFGLIVVAVVKLLS